MRHCNMVSPKCVRTAGTQRHKMTHPHRRRADTFRKHPARPQAPGGSRRAMKKIKTAPMTPAHPVAAFARRLADGWWRTPMLAVYTDGDRDSAQIRAAHLNAVIRLTPYTMAANFGNGALVLWAWRDNLPAGMLVWLATLYALCLMALAGWWRVRRLWRVVAT